jgi:hypothetical protein
LPQGRRVRRVIRRVDPWTVLRFSVFFYLSIFLVLLVAGIALWQVASVTGVRDNAEGFAGELVGAGPTTDPAGGATSTSNSNSSDNNFRFEGGRILQASALGGLVLVVVGTGANVLLVVLYNLISDVVGGIEMTVLEEETTSRPVI